MHLNFRQEVGDIEIRGHNLESEVTYTMIISLQSVETLCAWWVLGLSGSLTQLQRNLPCTQNIDYWPTLVSK